ncbi:sensor histidine kinase [Emticicia sp. SJ17W-69]|uniref:sensor histidine kinase n=1 Tax=Emticicia sp. SJ17W-69 TaxID=3421657 RepID=UPI003EBDF190
MKKIILLLIFFNFVSFAQQKTFTTFRDYQVFSNIDSLQKVVDSQMDKSSLVYLNSLIDLEMSRVYYSNDFGKDLEKIKTIALRNNNQLALAMFYYLEAKKLVSTDIELSVNYISKARKYFEQQKDTSGIIQSSFRLFDLVGHDYTYIDENKKKIGSIFANILSYYSNLKDVGDKLMIITVILSDGHLFGISIEKQLNLYETGLKLLNENPQFKYLSSRFYFAIANVYFRIHDKKGDYLKKIQWCYLKAYESLSPNLTRATVIALTNLGESYLNTKEFKKSEIYLKKGITVYNKIKLDEPMILYLLYSSLSSVQYEQKDYKNAYESRLILEEAQKNMNDKLKTKEMRELLTKYETEKKDIAIKNLELQKQVTEARTRTILFILGLTCLIIIAISFLAIRLRNANDSLKKLTKSRDKLFTIISHDLRSPFNSYQRYSEIVGYLIKTKQFGRLEEVLKKIDIVGLNLSALLNNLLEWSIVQQKQIKISLSEVNIQEFFNALLPLYRDLAQLKNVVIIEDFQDQIIMVDRQLLSLISRNLLDNAIKYTPEGNEILLKTELQENDFVMRISNRGDAMTNRQKEKISALFNNNYDYEFGEEGLGIGLILIKEFAQANCVSIRFDHSDDHLTTFEVIIPQAFV